MSVSSMSIYHFYLQYFLKSTDNFRFQLCERYSDEGVFQPTEQVQTLHSALILQPAKKKLLNFEFCRM